MHSKCSIVLVPQARHSGVELRGATFGADMALLLDRLTPLIRPGAVAVVTGRQPERRRQWQMPGEGKLNWFSDIDGGPQLVVVPSGRFKMGSPVEEFGREPIDEAQSEQDVLRPFVIGRTQITVDQFSKFVSATGKAPMTGAYRWAEGKGDYVLAGGRSWQDLGGDHPVVCISWTDAAGYVAWLSEMSGWRYRLPSHVEWEYAARAGTTSPFHWGGAISPGQANYDARKRYRGGGDRGEASAGPMPVFSFEPNPWGLYQVHGNVWEMCQEQWPGDPSLRICCGGSFEDEPEDVRSAVRSDVSEYQRYVSVGFRVVRDIG